MQEHGVYLGTNQICDGWVDVDLEQQDKPGEEAGTAPGGHQKLGAYNSLIGQCRERDKVISILWSEHSYSLADDPLMGIRESDSHRDCLSPVELL